MFITDIETFKAGINIGKAVLGNRTLTSSVDAFGN
jgi:hypothetical protein